MRRAGWGAGIAVFGSIGIALYRATLPAELPGVPMEAIEAARHTLGGAMAVAASLPAPAAADLLENARQAFTNGMQVASALSAAGSLVLALTLARAQSDVRR